MQITTPIFSTLKHSLIAFLVFINLNLKAGAALQINEIMQSNIDCIMDDLNEFPDSWVELYNNGESPIQLGNFSLSIKDDSATAYQLPNVMVNPKDFLIIYCDKANIGLHTSFRLESGKGCNVYLYQGNAIVDKIEGLKKQPSPNISYGRKAENSDKWGYQANPTPGQQNCGKIVKDILPAPLFSMSGRIMSEPIELTISLPENTPEGTKIYYTTDGSEPDVSSHIYTTALPIDTTTILRAKLICDGYLSPRSTVQSYIFYPRKLTLPLVSIVSPDQYFYDDKLGIYIEGSYDKEKPNFSFDWRRPINFEYFVTPESDAVVNQLCETRVKGATSRYFPVKSLVLYANKRFGEKRLSYEFFPEDAPQHTDWKSIELRNAGNDYNKIYMRDAVIQRVMGRNTDLDWQPYQPAILMINGEYKGIINVRSRSNEDYVYTFYAGLEDIDMIENWWEIKAGDNKEFINFKAFFNETDHSLKEYEEHMDTEEFANLMLMNLFFDNKDFPGNNIVMWRPKNEQGRWRWIAKDTDSGLSRYQAPYN